MNDDQETKLERFFYFLGQLYYEKAKIILEKERGESKVAVGTAWTVFLSALVQLCNYERCYASFTFLVPKGILSKKDNLRENYCLLNCELRRSEDMLRAFAKQSASTSSVQNSGDVVSSTQHNHSLLAHLIEQVAKFTIARSRLIDVYEQLSLMPIKLATLSEDLLILLDELMKTQERDFHHPLFTGLKAAFTYELEILYFCLRAYSLMSHLNFMEPLVCLHEATARLNAWAEMGPNETRLNARQHFPSLYLWLLRYKKFVMSKYTLYFYNVLSLCPAHPQEARAVSQRDDPDFVGKTYAFLRRGTDALLVALLFSATQQSHPYLGHGYFLPGTVGEMPTGRDSYPVIFCCAAQNAPEKTLTHADLTTVIMLMTSELEPLPTAEWDKIIYVYDDKLGRSYYVIRIESRIYMTLVQVGRSQRDKSFDKFLTEMSVTLRGHVIVGQLKSTIK